MGSDEQVTMIRYAEVDGEMVQVETPLTMDQALDEAMKAFLEASHDLRDTMAACGAIDADGYPIRGWEDTPEGRRRIEEYWAARGGLKGRNGHGRV